MANIPAILNNSDFSLPATWLGGVVPGVNDVALANGKIVRVSSAHTMQALSVLADTDVVAGGGFVLSNGGSLTVTDPNGIRYGAATVSVITTDLLAGQSASLSAGTTTSADLALHNLSLVNHTTAGTLNVSGNYAGVSRGASTIEMSSTGTLNITGNVSAVGGVGYVIAPGVRLSGNGTVNHTGNVLGSSTSSAAGALNSSYSGVYNLTGNYTGGMIGAGIENTSTGTFNAIGVGRSGTGAPAIGRGSVNQVTRISGPLELGPSGNINPKQAQSIRWVATLIPTSEQMVRSDGTTRRDLYTADNMPTGGYPVASNVVALTIYGPNNEFTGTYANPPVSSVAQGVPVGNGVGTAVLTTASVRAAIGLDSANMDTQFAAIPGAVWSAAIRTLTSSSAPTATDVATAVWSTATRTITGGTINAVLDKAGYSLTAAERQAIATAVEQSILNENDGQQVLNAIVGAIGNSNIDQIALIAAIRSDLERVGGKIDTRLATASYAAPPSAAAIASTVWTNTVRTITGGTVDTLVNAPSVPSKEAIAGQVRIELAPELDRLKNCSTMDTTATAIQDALNH